MNEIYLQLREEARKIVATLPLPVFYQQFSEEITYSRQMLHSHPLLVKIKQEINSLVEDDFGHGLRHSDLVCVDAGAIVQIEMQSQRYNDERKNQPEPERNHHENTGYQNEKIKKNILLVQIAGLLHDIKRKEKNHSAEGAKFARAFLSTGIYQLTKADIDIICCAIIRHEAFRKKGEYQGYISDGAEEMLISNALYDADKFRWGPDNFTHTVWDMVIFSNAPLSEFIKRYPAGMAILEQIKNTFRTETGKQYGPDFIELGIETGNRLLEIIRRSKMP